MSHTKPEAKKSHQLSNSHSKRARGAERGGGATGACVCLAVISTVYICLRDCVSTLPMLLSEILLQQYEKSKANHW
jgi:hypothetical protein